MTFNPAHYQRGDVIEVRQTFQVIDVFESELLTFVNHCQATTTPATTPA